MYNNEAMMCKKKWQENSTLTASPHKDTSQSVLSAHLSLLVFSLTEMCHRNQS